MQLALSFSPFVQKPFLSGQIVTIPAGISYKNNQGEVKTTLKSQRAIIEGFASCDIQSYQVEFIVRTIKHKCVVPANLLYLS